jgi:hypothetical protein
VAWLTFPAWLLGLLVFAWAGYTCAEELPKELLLQCEGAFKSMSTSEGRPDFHEGSFKIILRLRNGEIGNIEKTFLEGRDCALKDGKIRCILDATAYYPELNTTIVEHRSVSINRATGELGLFLEASHFKGKRATGIPSMTSKLSRVGVCRPASRGSLF